MQENKCATTVALKTNIFWSETHQNHLIHLEIGLEVI